MYAFFQQIRLLALATLMPTPSPFWPNVNVSFKVTSFFQVFCNVCTVFLMCVLFAPSGECY